MPKRKTSVRALVPLERLKAEHPFRFQWDRRKKKEPAPQPNTWLTPAGPCPNLYADVLNQPHVFFAAPQGPERDRVRDGVIHAALFEAPCRLRLILLDFADFGMLRFRELPHVKGYTRHPVTGAEYLQRAVGMMEKRMAARKGTVFPALWIILDGLDVLPAEQKEAMAPLIRQILTQGEKADVHLLALAAATGEFDASFPAHAFLLGGGVSYRTAERNEVCAIPQIEDQAIERQIRWWMDQKERV